MQLNLKFLKGITAVLAIGALGICISCGSDEPKVNVNINVAKDAPDAADGFDLEQFHRLLLEEKPESGQWDAKFLADLVNREDINNLDLNQNGEVDIIRIEPFGGGDSVGFELYTKIKSEEPGVEDQEQTIATIMVEKEGEGTASLSVSGNEQIYGESHHYHHGGMGMGSYFFLAYMMSPRFGGYGGGYGYGGRRTVSKSTYKQNMNNRNAASTNKAPSSTRSATAPKSAAKTRTASNVKAGLKKPSSTQRKFQTQQKAKAASGFAKKQTGTNKSRSTGRTSTSRSRGGK